MGIFSSKLVDEQARYITVRLGSRTCYDRSMMISQGFIHLQDNSDGTMRYQLPDGYIIEKDTTQPCDSYTIRDENCVARYDYSTSIYDWNHNKRCTVLVQYLSLVVIDDPIAYEIVRRRWKQQKEAEEKNRLMQRDY